MTWKVTDFDKSCHNHSSGHFNISTWNFCTQINKRTVRDTKMHRTCAKNQERSGIQDLEDPGSWRILDPGAWRILDPGAWRILDPGAWRILDPLLAFVEGSSGSGSFPGTAFAGSCGSWILFRIISAGSWGSWILLRENSLAQVSLRPLNKRFWWTVWIFGASCDVFFSGGMEGYRGHRGSNIQDFGGCCILHWHFHKGSCGS